MGHLRMETTMRYMHLAPSHLGLAAKALAEYEDPEIDPGEASENVTEPVTE